MPNLPPENEPSPQLADAYREPFTPSEVNLPVPGRVLSPDDILAATEQLFTQMDKIAEVNTMVNRALDNTNALLDRVEMQYGKNSPQYQSQLGRQQGLINGPSGYNRKKEEAQRALVDIILDGDPTTLLGVLRDRVDAVDNRDTASVQDINKAAGDRKSSDDKIVAMKKDPATRAAIDKGYAGSPTKFPTVRLDPPKSLKFKLPFHFEDGKLRKPRMDRTPQKVYEKLKAESDIPNKSYRRGFNNQGVGFSKDPRDSRRYQMELKAAIGSESAKKHVEDFVNAVNNTWKAEQEVRTAIAKQFETKGLSSALVDEVVRGLARREQAIEDAAAIQEQLSEKFQDIPLGATITEDATLEVEVLLNELSSKIQSLRPADPLRTELYRQYNINTLKLHQRLALTSDPDAFPIPTTSFNGFERSVTVETNYGAMTIFEDGSFGNSSTGRINTDGTLWTDPGMSTPDNIDNIYHENKTDSDAGWDSTDYIGPAFIALDLWETDKDPRAEVKAANAFRIASEKINTDILELIDGISALKTRQIGSVALGDATATDKIATELEELEAEYYSLQEEKNIATYWRCFLGITKPISSGLNSATANMSGRGGQVITTNLELNGHLGEWSINIDGSATLNDSGVLRAFNSRGEEI